MDLGFETCGNATIIAYDAGTPVLVTDPWIAGQQYFGSWALPYEIPERQRQAIASTRYVWLSHGHPDHLNMESLERLRDRKLLVPAHYGRRILNDLRAAGFDVAEAPNGEWLPLSPRVRIMSLADWAQDAVCLIALGDRCIVVDLNDGAAHGNRGRIRSAMKGFARRFVLKLENYGDADMMNFFTEAGVRIPPLAGEKPNLGRRYSSMLKQWGGTHSAVFSCHHVYARKDSEWAAAYETPIEAHADGFDSGHAEFIPGYFAYDALRDRVDMLAMAPVAREFRDPAEFGDNWSDVLEPEDVRKCEAYFRRSDHLRRKLGFINLRVGGKDNVIPLQGPRKAGITFEVPRGSLMTAVEHRIFDDLLIGNFMRTTLHGPVEALYPDFNPHLPKYGDNGGAYTDAELRAYFRHYARASGFEYWVETLQRESTSAVRRLVRSHPQVRRLARSVRSRLTAN